MPSALAIEPHNLLANRTLRIKPRKAGYLHRWAPIKSWHALLCASLLFSGQGSAADATEPACPIEGELVQWIADYCMLTLETDDEIIASECIAEELTLASKDKCKAKHHYKRAMCKVVVVRDANGTIEQCVADRSFAGSTVTNGGVGARQAVPADGPRLRVRPAAEPRR